jgi:hypothetical protein
MSERIYSLILRLYPRAFRERYADEMLRVFRERMRDEHRLRVWLDLLADAIVSIPQQHLAARAAHARFPPAKARLQQAILAAVTPTLILSLLLGMGMGASVAAAFIVGGIWPPAAMVLIVGASVAGCRRASRIRRSIVVAAEVDGDSITIACPAVGIEPQTLRRHEVVGLEITKRVGMRVRTADPGHDLWLPANAPGFADVQARLSLWAPVTVKPLFFDLPPEKTTAWQPVMQFVVAAVFPLVFALPFLAVNLVLIVFGATRRPVPWRLMALWAGPVVIALARWLW